MAVDGERKRAPADRSTKPLSPLVAHGTLLERRQGHSEPEREGDNTADDGGGDESAARGPTQKTDDKAERQRRRSGEQEDERRSSGDEEENHASTRASRAAATKAEAPCLVSVTPQRGISAAARGRESCREPCSGTVCSSGKTVNGMRVKTAASFFAAALAFALLATSAAAKERIKSARVCGAFECVTVTDRKKANLLVSFDASGSPPPASPFYTVELAMGAGGGIRSTFYYVPSAGMARPANEPSQAGPSLRLWSTVAPEAAALFREVARALEPFPKPRLSSVQVGSKTMIDGADSYLRLFELPDTSGTGGLPLAYSEWVDLRAAQPTPWTDSASDLSFSPSGGLLARGGQAVRIPEELLADMVAGRPLEGGDDGAFSAWRTLVATLGAALAAAVTLAFVLRRVRMPRPASATSHRPPSRT